MVCEDGDVEMSDVVSGTEFTVLGEQVSIVSDHWGQHLYFCPVYPQATSHTLHAVEEAV